MSTITEGARVTVAGYGDMFSILVRHGENSMRGHVLVWHFIDETRADFIGADWYQPEEVKSWPS